ncbi:MAG: adenine deaminase [Bacteroidetes bacterium HGW-Bacteroidetes-9]|jgi:adenine deaminase|nr:MAG: adenine deaminase [Bacteroidetes bacterium HGW-Bacteroidetes-9]
MNLNSGFFSVTGQIVDVVSGKIFPGRIEIEDGKIVAVEHFEHAEGHYILPGLIDAHVHIESSMLLPSEFARLSVVHGTTTTVSDPHEIANVLGKEGIRFMIENGRKVPFRFYFGAPACVPATPFETSGAEIGPEDVDEILSWPEINYLSEMMNFPGVLNGDPVVKKKLASAKKYGKPVDGHAPGLDGEDAIAYANAGISTDHECFTTEEAIDKIKAGMKILIREGSAARNFDELIPLISEYPQEIMFCSDDKHPDDLVNGHINLLVKRSLKAGYRFMEIMRACTLNPVRHYNLESGLLQLGDKADFIVVDHPDSFNVISTYVDGIKVAENGKTLIESVIEKPINLFNARKLKVADLEVKALSDCIKVQQALEGQLITVQKLHKAKIVDGNVVSSAEDDVLKMMVMNRYSHADPAIDFVSGFGFKRGAIASTVAHDSHNIIAVGVDDASIVKAVNLLIDVKGGISYVDGKESGVLPLPVAGLMSDGDGYQIADLYSSMNLSVMKLGSELDAPFMTLSFMALLVIPAIKLSDKGIFDGTTFNFTTLFK